MKLSTYRLLCVAFIVARSSLAQEGQITVRVTDESGSVVSNAEVHAGFNTAIKPGWGWGSGKDNVVKGHTDTNGLCVLNGTGNGGSVGIAAHHDGYYWSSGHFVEFTNLVGLVNKKWQPWNPVVDVVLKRIGNPIPMYARSTREMNIPVEAEAVGFDLIKADWVAPHGRGEVVDLLFRLDRAPSRVVSTRYGDLELFDVALLVSFPNEGDGIQSVIVPIRGGGSNLRLPATAPESGYASNLVKRVAREQDKQPFSNIAEGANYFFRVRTNKDETGKIVSSLYGKIYGDIRFGRDGVVQFLYYLNPTPNDRNMEFDPAKNLFKNLSSPEEVREP